MIPGGVGRVATTAGGTAPRAAARAAVPCETHVPDPECMHLDTGEDSLDTASVT